MHTMAFPLHQDGKAVQFDIETLREMARTGDLPQDQYIYDDGKGEWIGAALVAEMAGAWNIEENEATVAMEIPPDFFDEVDLAAAPEPAAPAPVAYTAPAPAPAPVAMVAMTPEPVYAAPEPAPAARGGGNGGGNGGGGGHGGGGHGGGGGRGGNGGRGASANLPHGEWISPVKVVLFTVLTCGIYGLVWLWKRLNEINTFLGREELKPMFFFGGLFCGPLFWVLLWKMIKVLPELGQKAGVEIEDRAVVLLLLLLCFPYGFYYLVQQDLNTVWEACGAQPDS